MRTVGGFAGGSSDQEQQDREINEMSTSYCCWQERKISLRCRRNGAQDVSPLGASSVEKEDNRGQQDPGQRQRTEKQHEHDGDMNLGQGSQSEGRGQFRDS